jgi:hypothetical protein
MDTSMAVLIPAYHLSVVEIADILQRLPKDCESILVVYNDNQPSVRSYVESLEKAGRLHAAYFPFQVGKTEAVRSGLRRLLDASTAKIIVQMDGHMKQPPEESAGIVAQLVNTNSHMIVANRYDLQNMKEQEHRVAISGLISVIVAYLTGYKLHDVVCGMRAYVRELAEHFCHVRSFGYGLELEEILIAAAQHSSVGEWPVHSNLQADATNTEKIEDNIFTLINYAGEMQMSDSVRAALSFMLVKIKQRKSFDIDMAVFGSSGIVQFEYVGNDQSKVDSYTSGTAQDGYSLVRLS